MRKRSRNKEQPNRIERNNDSGSGSDNESIGDIFNDEISDFTNERNQIDFESDESDSDKEEAIFNLNDSDEDDSDEEIGEWSKRLKQIKFQTKLDKKKVVADLPEKSWGSRRSDFYGSGVKRKPDKVDNEEDDEWIMEEKEVEKLQQKLSEGVDEDDFMIPHLKKGVIASTEVNDGLEVKRNLTEKEKMQHQKKLHPEAEPLREELNKCLEVLETLKSKKQGWKVESKDTCFRLLAANIAFYLHLIENNEDCRGHPVLKRIVQWKKLAKMYDEIPSEYMEESESETNANELLTSTKESSAIKRPRIALSDSEDEDYVENEDNGEEEGASENRPITYEMEKNKVDKKKSAPNNPRVKHREKFRKAKIRRRGKIREYRPEINKYQGEASGIRAGIVRSTRFK